MSIYERIFGSSRLPGEYAKKNLYYCDRAGYLTDNPEFIIDREHIDNYLFVYVITGYFHMDIKGTKSVVPPGNCAIINLKEKHRYFSDKNNPCEILWIDFNCTDDKILLLTSLVKLPAIFECRENFNLINEFVYQYVNNIQFDVVSQSEMLYRLILSAVLWIRRTSGYDLPGIPEVERFISENITGKITLSQLAGIMHHSTYHFLHIFKQKYGISPMQYVIRKKINRASYLLTYSNLTVSEIAEQLGFCSQSHFSALYKKTTGYFPSEFRKNSIKFEAFSINEN